MKIIKQLTLFTFLVVALVNCSEEDIRYIDDMVFGVAANTESEIETINEGSWNSALIGFKEKRLKLLGMMDMILNDGYSGDKYKLENPTNTAQRVEESLQMVEFKMDSVWNANIKGVFDAVNKNSAGIQAFGLKTYNVKSELLASYYDWLFADSEDPSLEVTSNDLKVLQSDIEILASLAALDDDEVNQFVADIKAQYAEMKAEYADLENEVNTSPYFSKAQKALYVSLEQPLIDMETTLNENLSLDVKADLDALDRDLYSLVYFVNNNYTSPAQAPVVYGQISSITELRWLSEVAVEDDLNRDWVLTADIDAAETARWNQEDSDGRFGFRPITTTTSINFDGQFHIISGLHMSKVGGAEDENRSGMFAKLVNGSIRNLGLINLRMTKSPGAGGGNQGGTLVGWISGSGGVTKCFVEGTFVGVGSQTGGFIGRPQSMTGEISDCFSVVDTYEPENVYTSSFIGLPVAVVNMFNCYNLGFTTNKAIFGHGSGVTLNASGIFYDSQVVGTTELDRGGNLYTAATVVTLSDPGVTTDLPTASWGDLANFSGFSADTWEIRTEPQFDPNPRPYLKGFNYEAITDFIAVDN